MLYVTACLLMTGVCMGTEWAFDADSELIPRALWAEQLSLSLLPAFSIAPNPTPDLSQCVQLLQEFANNSATLSNCLVSMARPVRLCQHCYKEYAQLKATVSKIGNPIIQNSTVSCSSVLLRSDRVQVIVELNDFFDKLWSVSKCDDCLEKNGTGVLNQTTKFMDSFDTLIECFNNTMKEPPISSQGNVSRVCSNCNETYRYLNTLYNDLDHGNGLCIDLEDAMNSTRKLWSKTFNCTLPCTDTVPVIAVSAFILFLPVVFYLSSFLHSEQKKRKLILPKRFKSAASVANIQDKRN